MNHEQGKALQSIASDALALMSCFHRHAKPDDSADNHTIFPAAAFREFVDGHANLMFRLTQLNKAHASAQPTDTARLDRLGEMAGYMRGTSEGEPAYRVMSRSSWHPTLRAAIDEVMPKSSTKNLPLDQE